MKLTIEQNELVGLIDRVTMAVDTRVSLPILANVLIKAQDGFLSVCGTNLEHQIVEKTNTAYIERDGEVTVSAKKLRDIVRSLPNKSDVQFIFDDETERLTVKSGRSRFQLSVLPARDYPTIHFEPDALVFETVLESDLLLAALQRVSFSAAKSDVRYYLNGVLFDFTHTKPDSMALQLCATDGHRLAMTKIEDIDAAVLNNTDAQYILPVSSIGLLERLLAKPTGLTRFIFYTKGVVIFIGDVTITVKLLDGKYPDYQRVIPSDLPFERDIQRDELIGILNRVRVLSNQQYLGCKFTFGIQDLVIVANNPDNEEASEEIDFPDAKTLGDEDKLTIGLSINYLLEVLTHMNQSSIFMQFQDANSSVRIINGMYETVYVIMPMRL